MSSILKALKKLEHDQATQKPGQINIDSRILQERTKPGLSRITMMFCIIVILMVGSSSTYYFMKRSTSDSISVAITNSVPLSGEILQQPDKNLQSDKKPYGTSSIEPDVTQPKIIRKLEKPSLFQANSPIVSSSAQQPMPHTTIIPAKAPDTTQAPSKDASTNVSSARPNLTINGIAFQDEGSDNLAVINGVTVSKGALIEGVKVEEILNDRVRFSQGGEKFEIILHKTNK